MRGGRNREGRGSKGMGRSDAAGQRVRGGAVGEAVGEAGAQLEGLPTRVCENLALRRRQSLWDLPLLWGPLISRPLPTLAVLSCGSWRGSQYSGDRSPP